MTDPETTLHIHKLKEAKSSLEAIKQELAENAASTQLDNDEIQVENVTEIIASLDALFEYYDIEFGIH
jgi:hypothetical protein